MALYDMCGGNLSEVERKTGIPDSTLSQWIKAQRLANHKTLPKLRGDTGLSLADNFEEIAFEVANVALRTLRSKGSDKIPFGQLMQGGSHAVQNAQLLRNLPTSITEERVQPRAVLVLMSNALGLAPAEIDVTPEHNIVTDPPDNGLTCTPE